MAKNKTDSFLNWHPDFRSRETLPDVKIIRTDFLVNFIALTCPLLLSGLLYLDWVSMRNLEEQIETQRQSIQASSLVNSQNVKKSKEFDVASAKLTDINNFLTRNIDELEVIIALAESRPKKIALSKITCVINENSAVSLQGVLKGISAEEVLMLDEYKLMLEKLPVFENKLDNVTMREPTLDADKELAKFNIKIDLKASR